MASDHKLDPLASFESYQDNFFYSKHCAASSPVAKKKKLTCQYPKSGKKKKTDNRHQSDSNPARIGIPRSENKNHNRERKEAISAGRQVRGDSQQGGKPDLKIVQEKSTSCKPECYQEFGTVK